MKKKKYFEVGVSVNFTMYVTVEATDKEEAAELAQEKAVETFRTADIDGVDTTVFDRDGIEEVKPKRNRSKA